MLEGNFPGLLINRQVVLKHLGNSYGRIFANHSEFVRYAHEQHLDLDPTSPLKRWGTRR